MASSNFLAALRTLREGGVEFLVVGGLAATLQGTEVGTIEVEIACAR